MALVASRTIWILELTAILRSHPRFNLSGVYFCKSEPRLTTFVIRGEPAVKREERRCADEITFVEVASTVVPAGSRQSDPARRWREGGKGLDVNAAPSPPPSPNPFSTRNRAIYRPPGGQPAASIPLLQGWKITGTTTESEWEEASRVSRAMAVRCPCN